MSFQEPGHFQANKFSFNRVIEGTCVKKDSVKNLTRTVFDPVGDCISLIGLVFGEIDTRKVILRGLMKREALEIKEGLEWGYDVTMEKLGFFKGYSIEVSPSNENRFSLPIGGRGYA